MRSTNQTKIYKPIFSIKAYLEEENKSNEYESVTNSLKNPWYNIFILLLQKSKGLTPINSYFEQEKRVKGNYARLGKELFKGMAIMKKPASFFRIKLKTFYLLES